MENNNKDRNTPEGLKKGKKNIYRRPKKAGKAFRKNEKSDDGFQDIYSKSGGKKKHNVKLIITNVVLSICLVISSLGFVAGSLGNMQLIEDNNVNEVETNENLVEIDVSENENVSYFLVAGLDLSESLTDIIMVVCYDLANNKASILQIPRDTYIGSESTSYLRSGGTGKINGVYSRAVTGESKIKALMRCINDRLGLPIDHYVTITIPGFRDIVDAMGGVTMTLDRAYTVEDSRPTDHGGQAVKITIGPGTVKLKGYEAEGFVRHRNSYSKGDIGRVEAQRKFYKALMQRVTELGKSDLLNVARNCYDDISTDLTIAQMLGYASKVSETDPSDITIVGIPGQAGTRNGQSYYFPHKAELVKVLNDQMRPYEEKVLTVDDISIEDCPNPYTWEWLEGTEQLGEDTKTTKNP
jgi:LCP family protein required for cell wall assembly